jgi:hypothetical protein
MKKLLLFFIFFFFACNLFAADIVLTQKTFAEPLDRDDNSDLQEMNGIGWNFFGDFFDKKLANDLKLDLGFTSGIILAVGTGEKKLQGEVALSADLLREVLVDPLPPDDPRRETVEEVIGDEGRTINVDETIPEVLAGVDFDLGLKIALSYQEFLNPYIATGFYNSLLNYVAGELGDNAEQPIESASSNTSVAGAWYAYGLSLNIREVLRLTLEKRVNQASREDFVTDNTDLSSTETRFLFNIGF